MQTANDSIDPGRVLECLGDLKSALEATLRGEDEVARKRKEGMAAIRRELNQRQEAAAAESATRHAARADEMRRAMAAAQERLAARQARIQRAYHGSRSALSERVQGLRDQQIGRLQGDIFQQRKARQEELAAAGAAHREFQARLAEDRIRRHEIGQEALAALRSFRLVLGLLMKRRQPAMADDGRGAADLRRESQEQLDGAAAAAAGARGFPPAALFRLLPLWVGLLVIGAVAGYLAYRSGDPRPLVLAAGGYLALWLLCLLLSLPAAVGIARRLGASRVLGVAAERASAARVQALAEEIQREEARQGSDLSETFRETESDSRERIDAGRLKLERQFAELPGRAERFGRRRMEAIESAYHGALAALQRQDEQAAAEREADRAAAVEALEKSLESVVETLAGPWRDEVLQRRDTLARLEAAARERFPAWSSEGCQAWRAPDEAPTAVRVGRLEGELEALAGRLPAEPGLELSGPGQIQAPFALGFPSHGSLMIETAGDGAPAAQALGGIALRLLASHPPGRVSFTFIDPVGLGKDFSGLMHLADYEETVINHRVWTQTTQIEEKLRDLNEHIEKVIQMYLRNEFADIVEYNEQAGTIAEKLRFLVIANFPAGFSETAARRLLSIATSGARCGVYLLIHRDLRQPLPDGALVDELQRACLRAVWDGGLRLVDAPAGADRLQLDPAPGNEDTTALVHRIGRASVDSNRVQVPFSQIAPPPGECWTGTTADELRVPVGRTGAKKLQMLALGKGTKQHMLVAGKTGSGKSTLFHVIITNLALWCSPDEVEFHLVDFKKGVEFRCYAAMRLPHARVIAIESDREFALSVLQRVDGELRRRGDLFRSAGVQDLAGYRRSSGSGPLPRSLLLIDEFQEFFTEDDAVAQEASLLLDRIVRQGRAFGIHVILGSQTLGGAYTLARATLGQMAVRVALQCNEADAQLIMDDENPAPRLLTRPGEGIYNDQSGALAANSPFQIVWLPEEERERALGKVLELASRGGSVPPVPLVFEGNAPADIRGNRELTDCLREGASGQPAAARAWLGAPNSIKGPTEALFRRQSGSHLLVVGQSAERSMSMLALAALSLAAQYPAGAAEFVILDGHAGEGDESLLQRLPGLLPHAVRMGGPAELPALMGGLAAALEARAETLGRGDPEIFLLVRDLHRFKALRPEDDFRFSMDEEPAVANPSQTFASLLGEGGAAGIHVLAATDTWNNVSRWIPRKLLAEFEMRVLFQMSANDSSSLIDSPAASALGLHRALFHNEHLGTLETFRPYALPDEEWLAEAAAGLAPAGRTDAIGERG
jgi:DNA segregation ATPase FtsK/SpoIIIE, S-DNA-T family